MADAANHESIRTEAFNGPFPAMHTRRRDFIATADSQQLAEQPGRLVNPNKSTDTDRGKAGPSNHELSEQTLQQEHTAAAVIGRAGAPSGSAASLVSPEPVPRSFRLLPSMAYPAPASVPPSHNALPPGTAQQNSTEPLQAKPLEQGRRHAPTDAGQDYLTVVSILDDLLAPSAVGGSASGTDSAARVVGRAGGAHGEGKEERDGSVVSAYSLPSVASLPVPARRVPPAVPPGAGAGTRHDPQATATTGSVAAAASAESSNSVPVPLPPEPRWSTAPGTAGPDSPTRGTEGSKGGAETPAWVAAVAAAVTHAQDAVLRARSLSPRSRRRARAQEGSGDAGADLQELLRAELLGVSPSGVVGPGPRLTRPGSNHHSKSPAVQELYPSEEGHLLMQLSPGFQPVAARTSDPAAMRVGGADVGARRSTTEGAHEAGSDEASQQAQALFASILRESDSARPAKAVATRSSSSSAAVVRKRTAEAASGSGRPGRAVTSAQRSESGPAVRASRAASVSSSVPPHVGSGNLVSGKRFFGAPPPLPRVHTRDTGRSAREQTSVQTRAAVTQHTRMVSPSAFVRQSVGLSSSSASVSAWPSQPPLTPPPPTGRSGVSASSSPSGTPARHRRPRGALSSPGRAAAASPARPPSAADGPAGVPLLLLVDLSLAACSKASAAHRQAQLKLTLARLQYGGLLPEQEDRSDDGDARPLQPLAVLLAERDSLRTRLVTLQSLRTTMSAPSYLAARQAARDKAVRSKTEAAQRRIERLKGEYESLLDVMQSLVEHDLLPLRAEALEANGMTKTRNELRRSCELLFADVGGPGGESADERADMHSGGDRYMDGEEAGAGSRAQRRERSRSRSKGRGGPAAAGRGNRVDQERGTGQGQGQGQALLQAALRNERGVGAANGHKNSASVASALQSGGFQRLTSMIQRVRDACATEQRLLSIECSALQDETAPQVRRVEALQLELERVRPLIGQAEVEIGRQSGELEACMAELTVFREKKNELEARLGLPMGKEGAQA